jgi:hypothetical protein
MCIAIYIFRLLDTSLMVGFRHRYPLFNNAVSRKVNDLLLEDNKEFTSYIDTHFEHNKKYLTKSKNRIARLRAYIHARRCFIDLYNKVKNKPQKSYCIIA